METQNQTSEPGQAGAGEGIVCVSYEAYDGAWGDFNKHINEQSGDHEIVSANQSRAMPLELKNLTYLIPLSFLGQSQKSSGKYDAAMEVTMLQVGWAKDADLIYDEKTGYLLKELIAREANWRLKSGTMTRPIPCDWRGTKTALSIYCLNTAGCRRAMPPSITWKRSPAWI
ncbi:MAG: hypothetical protein PHP51_03585 [Desulfotomaculaceae bacterium]|nr:hypothetical protein [Desulfotomaculaceae bacterium]MDD4767419.1 hypothetical protein [Desulfotomaculaceae bacterium]